MTSLFPETGGADVLSVHLGRSARSGDCAAIAYRTFSGVQVLASSAEGELISRLSELASPKALVLFDIPIDGCAGLSARSPFRQVDRALHRCGIPLLPSYKDAGRGAALRDALRAQRPDLRVEESNPYAVLRVLWGLKKTGQNLELGRDSHGRASLSEVWWDWPPTAKRGRDLEKRRAAVAEVAELLRAHFLKSEAVHQLAAAARTADLEGLNSLSERFDAVLGLVAGLAAAGRSPWSWRVSFGEDRGAVLTIADQWLRERFASSGSLLDI